MDHAQGLTEPAVSRETHPAVDCPDCGAPTTRLPAMIAPLLGPAPVRRCLRCGRRRTCEPVPRRVPSCADCGLPFLETDESDERCPACRNERSGFEAHVPSLAEATEREVLRALAEGWRFVGSDRTSRYLQRVLRQVAGGIAGAPGDGRLLLVDDPTIRSLALPSGSVILSVGALGAVEDEAELAFVLGHEIAHVSSGDAASALVRLSLRELARDDDAREHGGWWDAAQDVIRLGHGDRSEHDADAVSIAAMAEAGYETRGATRYLARIKESTDRGDPEVAELALAHPPAGERLMRLDGLRNRLALAESAGRVDREVFRRVVGPTALTSELVPASPLEETAGGGGLALRLPGGRWVWAAAAVGAAAVLAAASFLL